MLGRPALCAGCAGVTSFGSAARGLMCCPTAGLAAGAELGTPLEASVVGLLGEGCVWAATLYMVAKPISAIGKDVLIITNFTPLMHSAAPGIDHSTGPSLTGWPVEGLVSPK